VKFVGDVALCSVRVLDVFDWWVLAYTLCSVCVMGVSDWWGLAYTLTHVFCLSRVASTASAPPGEIYIGSPYRINSQKTYFKNEKNLKILIFMGCVYNSKKFQPKI
jgi:hypothetical protein